MSQLMGLSLGLMSALGAEARSLNSVNDLRAEGSREVDISYKITCFTYAAFFAGIGIKLALDAIKVSSDPRVKVLAPNRWVQVSAGVCFTAIGVATAAMGCIFPHRM